MIEGVFIGRCCPLTVGHEYIINRMLTNHGENSLVILGSTNVKVSPVNIFSFTERLYFVKEIFPNLQIVGIPDYNNNKKWLEHLDYILHQYNSSLKHAIFYIGNENDAYFFTNASVKTNVVDRYSGNAPKVSATQVRKNLYKNKDITGMVNPIIQENIISCFNQKLI